MNLLFIRTIYLDREEIFWYSKCFGMIILTAIFSLLYIFTGAVDARELKLTKNSREYQVEATIDRYPLVLGDNRIDIEIRDTSGKRVTDAEVLVNYYMPPMPRMVPMNYKTQAGLDDEKYEAEMDIIMAGPWYIKIIIKREGKISTIKFNVDAQ